MVKSRHGITISFSYFLFVCDLDAIKLALNNEFTYLEMKYIRLCLDQKILNFVLRECAKE